MESCVKQCLLDRVARIEYNSLLHRRENAAFPCCIFIVDIADVLFFIVKHKVFPAPFTQNGASIPG